jgi:A/G-specific adenine glycosylase
MAAGLATRVVRWQEIHGRNDLPWQNTRDPYRVWLSEIMLQQTQVATVKDYYARFLARFADVRALAGADLDDVLALWSGLGYYSRARNLYQCAVQIVTLHGGVFPQSAEVLQTLPGIGRSTAAAIAAICFGQRVAILDGNVKRVLSRALAFEADLSVAANSRALWDQAEKLLPDKDLKRTMPRYTQGLMDLGATVCSTRKPECDTCPLAVLCVAKSMGTQLQFPVKSKKIKRSAQTIWMLWALAPDGSVWLGKRPAPGVWAGLYCFPLFDDWASLEAAVPDRYRTKLEVSAVVKHVLTHKDLYLHPVQVELPTASIKEADGTWLKPEQWREMGLPAPIRKLLLSSRQEKLISRQPA